ncbi:hypothetical protein [Thiohalocapsa marina]|uniref:hypothetical protein n=1 Tax=Thiohalocapsa marina TaxID=424902 RepID=UPI0036DD547C
MPAKKTDLRAAVGGLASAVQQSRARLAELRTHIAALEDERAAILSAPLHNSDMASELARHLQRQAADTRHELRILLGEMRNKATTAATLTPDESPVFSPIESRNVAGMVAILSDPAEAAARLLAAAGELPQDRQEGLPLAERRAAVAEIDAQLETARAEADELAGALSAAGVDVANVRAQTIAA